MNRYMDDFVTPEGGLTVLIGLDWRHWFAVLQHQEVLIREDFYKPAAPAEIITVPSDQAAESVEEALFVQKVLLPIKKVGVMNLGRREIGHKIESVKQ